MGTLIQNGIVVTADRIEKADVLIESSTIKEVIALTAMRINEQCFDECRVMNRSTTRLNRTRKHIATACTLRSSIPKTSTSCEAGVELKRECLADS